MDKNAVPANEIAVKLRHAATNAKLARTPFNLESAIEALFTEALDLDGEDAAYHIAQMFGKKFAEYLWPPNENQSAQIVAALVQAIVNMSVGLKADEIAELIVGELHDMELLDA